MTQCQPQLAVQQEASGITRQNVTGPSAGPSAVNFPIEAIGKKKPEKKGFNGIRTRDLCDTGAMLYQLSYEATLWE